MRGQGCWLGSAAQACGAWHGRAGDCRGWLWGHPGGRGGIRACPALGRGERPWGAGGAALACTTLHPRPPHPIPRSPG